MASGWSSLSIDSECNGGQTDQTYCIWQSGLIPAVSRPQRTRAARCGGYPRDSEAEVGLRLNLEPKMRTAPTLAGRCAHCGEQVVSRLSYPGDHLSGNASSVAGRPVPLAYSHRRSGLDTPAPPARRQTRRGQALAQAVSAGGGADQQQPGMYAAIFAFQALRS